jgi:hypothetical protein
MYLFKKFKIIEFIDKFNVTFEDNIPEKKEKVIVPKKKKISDKIKINEITSKAISYYVFLVFFRFSIVII